jgi:hypothetical protein
MSQIQHLATIQDDIVLPFRLSPLVHVTNTTSDHTARLYCPTLSIISPHVQGEIIDKVGQYRLAMWSDVVFVTCTRGNNRQGRTISSRNVVRCCTTSDHTARRYCPTFSIISPCTCDKHNIWPQCKTILPYLVDYLPLYMWQTQHLTVVRCCVCHLYKGR